MANKKKPDAETEAVLEQSEEDAPEVESTKPTEEKKAPEGPATSETLFPEAEPRKQGDPVTDEDLSGRDKPEPREPFDPPPQVTNEQATGEPETEPQEATITDPEPPVAPVVEEGAAGSFKIISRAEGSDETEAVTEARFVGWNLHIVGEDFQAPGEVIIDVGRAAGYDHQRFSYWSDNGMVDVAVPGLNGPGNWRIHLETLVTQVGEGHEDGLPLVLTTDEVALTLY